MLDCLACSVDYVQLGDSEHEGQCFGKFTRLTSGGNNPWPLVYRVSGCWQNTGNVTVTIHTFCVCERTQICKVDRALRVGAKAFPVLQCKTSQFIFTGFSILSKVILKPQQHQQNTIHYYARMDKIFLYTFFIHIVNQSFVSNFIYLFF